MHLSQAPMGKKLWWNEWREPEEQVELGTMAPFHLSVL